MKKINILFLLLSLNIGGTERHIFNLVSNLDRKKFRSVICCLYDLGSIGKTLASTEGVKVYYNLIRSKWDIAGILKLLKIFRNENIHILYTINSPLTQFLGTVCARLVKVDVCLTRVAATKPIFHAKRRKVVNSIMLPFVDNIIAQAHSQKEYLIRHEGFKPQKVRVIYNGVDLEKFDKPLDIPSLKQTIGIPEDASVVGIVARLSPEKGHQTFLKASRKILDVFPSAHFLIVGDGEERKKLKKITHELAIHSSINFLGIRKDIPQIVSLFDVAVMSSNFETFSNSILEYMAASKPVVATNVGSIAELVIDGETGYLIPTGDSDALADRILRLLRNPVLAKKMGEAGRERVKEKFTIQKMIAGYESLFVDLFQKSHLNA